jgi:hypothetical protein
LQTGAGPSQGIGFIIEIPEGPTPSNDPLDLLRRGSSTMKIYAELSLGSITPGKVAKCSLQQRVCSYPCVSLFGPAERLTRHSLGCRRPSSAR